MKRLRLKFATKTSGTKLCLIVLFRLPNDIYSLEQTTSTTFNPDDEEEDQKNNYRSYGGGSSSSASACCVSSKRNGKLQKCRNFEHFGTQYNFFLLIYD